LGFIVGGATLALPIIKAIVSLAGDVDLIVSRTEDPGWVGVAMRWLSAQPDWLLLILVAIGLSLIYWNNHNRWRKITAIDEFPRRNFLYLLHSKRRDANTHQAVTYLSAWVWITGYDEFEHTHFIYKQFADALPTIEQAALDGSITVWGKRDSVYEPIPQSYWSGFKIEKKAVFAESKPDLISGKKDFPPVGTVARQGCDYGEPYHDLKFSRREFESINWQSVRLEEELLWGKLK